MKIDRRFWLFPLALAGVHTLIVGLAGLVSFLFGEDYSVMPGWIRSVLNPVGDVIRVIDMPIFLLVRDHVGKSDYVGIWSCLIALGAMYWFIIGTVLFCPVAFLLSRKSAKSETPLHFED